MTSVLMFYKEVRDHQGELKDKCTSKQCVENKEEVFRHCFKCFTQSDCRCYFLQNIHLVNSEKYNY